MVKTFAEKVSAFVALFDTQINERIKRISVGSQPLVVKTVPGYKFVKVYTIDTSGSKRRNHFMIAARDIVDKHGKVLFKAESIFGVKSWTQVNTRRQYGTLDMASQWDWSNVNSPIPLSNTDAEKWYAVREAQITSTHKKRGRKPNYTKLKGVTR